MLFESKFSFRTSNFVVSKVRKRRKKRRKTVKKARRKLPLLKLFASYDKKMKSFRGSTIDLSFIYT